mmetsp:Transcript_24756/g.80803  ORF Transcript_24756/g.80803 Transcript_24756/m.80803 type:complete len:529 (-) Transcript_24756:196-1782(-)
MLDLEVLLEALDVPAELGIVVVIARHARGGDAREAREQPLALRHRVALCVAVVGRRRREGRCLDWRLVVRRRLDRLLRGREGLDLRRLVHVDGGATHGVLLPRRRRRGRRAGPWRRGALRRRLEAGECARRRVQRAVAAEAAVGVLLGPGRRRILLHRCLCERRGGGVRVLESRRQAALVLGVGGPDAARLAPRLLCVRDRGRLGGADVEWHRGLVLADAGRGRLGVDGVAPFEAALLGRGVRDCGRLGGANVHRRLVLPDRRRRRRRVHAVVRLEAAASVLVRRDRRVRLRRGLSDGRGVVVGGLRRLCDGIRPDAARLAPRLLCVRDRGRLGGADVEWHRGLVLADAGRGRLGVDGVAPFEAALLGRGVRDCGRLGGANVHRRLVLPDRRRRRRRVHAVVRLEAAASVLVLSRHLLLHRRLCERRRVVVRRADAAGLGDGVGPEAARLPPPMHLLDERDRRARRLERLGRVRRGRRRVGLLVHAARHREAVRLAGHVGRGAAGSRRRARVARPRGRLARRLCGRWR